LDHDDDLRCWKRPGFYFDRTWHVTISSNKGL